MKHIAVAIIVLYQALVSPVFKQLFGESCRFQPTCSEYTKQMIRKYGIIKGSLLGLSQLSSCHPWARN